MSLVKVRGKAQITLPGDVRQALGVKEGDYLEATLVDGGVLLTPVAVLDRAEAWRRLRGIVGGARMTGTGRQPSEDDVMRMAVKAVKGVRRGRREGRP